MSCAFCYRTQAASKRLGITLHSFPKDNEMRKAWIDACVSRYRWFDKHKKSMKLCSVHFTLNDYEAGKEGRTVLKKGVVPSRFWRESGMHCIVCSHIGSANSNVYLHEFPDDKIFRPQWIEACRQNGFNVRNISPHHAICTKHFILNSDDISDDDEWRDIEPDEVPFVFPVPITAASSVQPRSENVLATSTSISSVDVNSCPVLPRNGIATNSSTTSKYVTDTSAVVRKSIKRRVPCTQGSVSRCRPAQPRTNIRVWRPARAGDLREEHFSTPRRAKRNFHLLSGKCKEYERIIAQYRIKTRRLQRKLKDLENLLLHLTDKT